MGNIRPKGKRDRLADGGRIDVKVGRLPCRLSAEVTPCVFARRVHIKYEDLRDASWVVRHSKK